MPPNTFTCLRLRSTSSDSSHTTWDIDEKSGGPSARVEALDRAEPLDPHVLAPRRRVLKRPASQISSDSFKYWRACPHVLCSRHLCRILHNCLTSEKDDVASARGDKHAKDELSDETEQDAMTVQADDGDIIQDRRAGPYGLSSPHLGRRLDHSSIHVLTNATDQDEVAQIVRTSTRGTSSVTRQWSQRMGCWQIVSWERTRIGALVHTLLIPSLSETRQTKMRWPQLMWTSTRRTSSVTRQWSKRMGCWKMMIWPGTRIGKLLPLFCTCFSSHSRRLEKRSMHLPARQTDKDEVAAMWGTST